MASLDFKFNHVFCELKIKQQPNSLLCQLHCFTIVILLSFLLEEDLGSATLDDSFVFKIVEELEDWKERQQELFKAEVMHIFSLSCLWFIDSWSI